MKVVMMGDIADAMVQTVAQAIPAVDESALRVVVLEALPESGIVIDANRVELATIEGNLLYEDVEVKRVES